MFSSAKWGYFLAQHCWQDWTKTEQVINKYEFPSPSFFVLFSICFKHCPVYVKFLTVAEMFTGLSFNYFDGTF